MKRTPSVLTRRQSRRLKAKQATNSTKTLPSKPMKKAGKRPRTGKLVRASDRDNAKRH